MRSHFLVHFLVHFQRVLAGSPPSENDKLFKMISILIVLLVVR